MNVVPRSESNAGMIDAKGICPPPPCGGGFKRRHNCREEQLAPAALLWRSTRGFPQAVQTFTTDRFQSYLVKRQRPCAVVTTAATAQSPELRRAETHRSKAVFALNHEMEGTGATLTTPPPRYPRPVTPSPAATGGPKNHAKKVQELALCTIVRQASGVTGGWRMNHCKP